MLQLLVVSGEAVVMALHAAAASLGLSQGRMRLCTAAKHVWVICWVRYMTTGASLFSVPVPLRPGMYGFGLCAGVVACLIRFQSLHCLCRMLGGGVPSGVHAQLGVLPVVC